MTQDHEQAVPAPAPETPYPMETIVRQYGKWRLTAIQPATREGKNALVKQALPQIAELLRAYDRRMAQGTALGVAADSNPSTAEGREREAQKRAAEKESAA